MPLSPQPLCPPSGTLSFEAGAPVVINCPRRLHFPSATSLLAVCVLHYSTFHPLLLLRELTKIDTTKSIINPWTSNSLLWFLYNYLALSDVKAQHNHTQSLSPSENTEAHHSKQFKKRLWTPAEKKFTSCDGSNYLQGKAFTAAIWTVDRSHQLLIFLLFQIKLHQLGKKPSLFLHH